MISDEPPSLVHGAVMGAIATSFLAGPTFCLIVAAWQFPGAGEMPSIGRLSSGLAVVLIFGTIIGLLGAIPAAIANATVLVLLAQQDFDGRLPAILSGAICGAIVAPIGLNLLSTKEGVGYWGSDDNIIAYVVCLAVTGALMGLIHWSVAIRPYRRWRLHTAATERDSAY